MGARDKAKTLKWKPGAARPRMLCVVWAKGRVKKAKSDPVQQMWVKNDDTNGHRIQLHVSLCISFYCSV
ncbi:hypothetical protein NQZ68_012475 [Dissostichus eleginoides]|nr:hypothetical protein NQZ68_012475 [Dissostichus eleginoides]